MIISQFLWLYHNFYDYITISMIKSKLFFWHVMVCTVLLSSSYTIINSSNEISSRITQHYLRPRVMIEDRVITHYIFCHVFVMIGDGGVIAQCLWARVILQVLQNGWNLLTRVMMWSVLSVLFFSLPSWRLSLYCWGVYHDLYASFHIQGHGVLWLHNWRCIQFWAVVCIAGRVWRNKRCPQMVLL